MKASISKLTFIVIICFFVILSQNIFSQEIKNNTQYSLNNDINEDDNEEDPFEDDEELGPEPDEVEESDNMEASDKSNTEKKSDDESILEDAGEEDFSKDDDFEIMDEEDEDKFKIGGIFYNDFFSTFHSHPDNMYWGNLLKLRLKLNWDINPELSVHCEALYLNLQGEQNTYIIYNNFGFLSPTDRLLIWSEASRDKNFNEKFLIDQAFLSIKKDYLSIKLGKHVIAWGSGYMFNPTNRASFIPIFDPSLEYAGVTGLTYSLRFGEVVNLKGYFTLDDRSGKKFPIFEEQDYQNIGYGVKLSRSFTKVDLGISFIQELFYDSMYNPITYPEGRFTHPRYLGLDISADIFTAGFYVEGTYKIPEKRENRNHEKWNEKQIDAIVGFDYTFECELQVRIEYFRQGSGETDKDKYNAAETFALHKYVLARDYVYMGLNMPNMIGFLSGNLGGLLNANDQSVIIFPELTYDVYQDLEVKLGAYVFLGDKGTEFNGRIPYFDAMSNTSSIKHFYYHTIYTKVKAHF